MAILDSLIPANAYATTKLGSSRRKFHIKALCQSFAFLALLIGYTVHNFATQESEKLASPHDYSHDRSLAQTCDELDKANPKWLIAFYAVGVLYMFLALAIVCDEFFVPALEEMSSKRRLNLSMDVAGATLMAAGGSAPELFSSLFGTFTESEIGFGTIIGSAVFNVLFVIAMCAIFSKEVLALTWWPLFRDSTFYAVGLVVLCIFVGVSSKERIELWEACILFGMYILYALIMWKNADIYRFITGKELEYPDEEDDDGFDEENVEQHRPPLTKMPSAASVTDPSNLLALKRQLFGANKSMSFRWQGTFRAGILKLMRDPHSWYETGGMGIVAKIAGDANYIFRQIDVNEDGFVDRDELRELFKALDHHVTDHELDEVFAMLDIDKDGKISQEEFNKWYTNSAELIRSQTRQVFDSLDKDKSGTLDKDEIKELLVELDPEITDDDVAKAVEAMYMHGSREEVTFEEFEDWYEKSMVYERQRKAVEEDMEGVMENIKPPFGESYLSWAQYILVLPLVIPMTFTIPDVRRPGWSPWCYLAFMISIGWIGLFSYFMVIWAEIIGNTIGIPSVIMGVTVLAAGTSVPDLLSSVIVARRGSGDMAVSSSIGSNIFDILVGLPIPWIMYTAWPSKPDEVIIGSDNIWIWIFILLGMLVFVIVAVHFQGWKLTGTLAAMMMLFYFAFLGIAIYLELPFETCIKV